MLGGKEPRGQGQREQIIDNQECLGVVESTSVPLDDGFFHLSDSSSSHQPFNNQPTNSCCSCRKSVHEQFHAGKDDGFTLVAFSEWIHPPPPLSPSLASRLGEGLCYSELVFVSQPEIQGDSQTGLWTGSLSSLCKPEGLMQMPCDAAR